MLRGRVSEMPARRTRRGRRSLKVAALATVVSVTVLSGGTSGAASPTTSQVYELDADVSNANAGTPPNVSGVTGSFVVHNVADRTNNTAQAESPDGSLTIELQNSTKFYRCDVNGENCGPSDQGHTVINGARVRVDGKWYRTNGSYEFLATYVFSPPPADVPPPPPNPNPPNPKPTSPKEYALANIYYYQAFIVRTNSDVAGGFTLGRFVDYGCGTTPGCKTERIARAHNNFLIIDPQPNSKYYLGDGCNYVQTTNTNAVFAEGAQNGVAVAGHYTSDVGDWIFFSNNVFAPPPKPANQCGIVPLPTTYNVRVLSTLAQQSTGTYDSPTGTWNNSQWQGTNGIGDFGGGITTMTLAWHQDTDGSWDFWGNYRVAASAPDTSSISGEINGTASAPAPGTELSNVNANVTVDQATGKYAGLQGMGSWSGRAQFANPGPTAPQPPVSQNGTWSFVLTK